MEEDFFQQNDFLCEMALQNQFNYCLKIRKLKLRVTIYNLNQFFMKINFFKKNRQGKKNKSNLQFFVLLDDRC